MIRISVLLVMSIGLSVGCVESSSSPHMLVGSVTRVASSVATRACKGCHGDDMAGRTDPFHDDTTYLPDTISYASNLTPDMATGIGSWSDAQLDVAIRVGVDGTTKPMCEPMPVYAMMSDQEVADVIAYMRSLPAVNRDIPESSCPSQQGGPHGE